MMTFWILKYREAEDKREWGITNEELRMVN